MKKTKFMTRLGAVVFALAILFAMAVPALADTTTNAAGENVYQGAANTSVYDLTNNTITLSKSIVFFNADSKTVYEPNIAYTYTVTPVTVDANTTITDSTPKTVHVKTGETNVFGPDGNTVTITFGGTNTSTTSPEGVEVLKSGSITFVPDNFSSAGVYRYKITETIPGLTDVTDVGLTARGNDYSVDRYLDVYIRNSTAANAQPGEKEMYGAVIFKTGTYDNSGTQTSYEGKDPITTSTDKTTGFEPGGDPSSQSGQQGQYTYANDGTVDRYTTYNVTVTKAVDGSLGDKTHQFPFSFSIANSIAGAKYSYDKGNTTVSPDPVANDGTSAVNDNYTTNLTLANGESFTVYGVPSNQTTGSEVAVTVSEKNTTPDVYTVAIVEGNNTLTPNPATLAATATATTSSATVIKAASTKTIAFTNTLNELSPTGLAFRVAPYVLMLTAGISLVLLFAKRRREITDMI